MKKRKCIIAKVMSFVLMMTMILSLTACGGSSSADAGYKEELHIAFSAQPSTLDAQISSASSVRQITRAVYESLVALNTSYEAVPELAESVDVNDDSTEFVFHLRKDVKFHNGEEMKADDVVASMNRWIEKFGNAKTLVGEARFVKQDDYTVSITMDKPCISFLNAIAGAKQVAAIMPASVIAGADDSGVKEYIGTGPYKFVEWKQDQYILLEKFDSYSPVDKPSDGYSGKKEALTEKVYFDIVSDASTRLSGIQTGEYDIAANLAIDNYSLIESNPELVTDTELSMAMQVILNKQQGLCANEKFRQGIAAALNMDDILLGAFSNSKFYRADSSYMFKEQTAWYSTQGSEYYNQKNTEKAKQLIKESGYNGEDFTLIVSQAYPEFYNSGIVIKNQLDAIGVNVKLQVVDWATQQQLMTQPDKYDGFITGFTPVTSPTDLLYLSSNWAGWTTDSEIQNLVSEINEAKTQSEAQQIWQNLQKICWEKMPVIKLGDSYSFGAHSSNVEGFTNFMGPIIWNVRVKA